MQDVSPVDVLCPQHHSLLVLLLFQDGQMNALIQLQQSGRVMLHNISFNLIRGEIVQKRGIVLIKDDFGLSGVGSRLKPLFQETYSGIDELIFFRGDIVDKGSQLD